MLLTGTLLKFNSSLYDVTPLVIGIHYLVTNTSTLKSSTVIL